MKKEIVLPEALKLLDITSLHRVDVIYKPHEHQKFEEIKAWLYEHAGAFEKDWTFRVSAFHFKDQNTAMMFALLFSN